jgi:DNA modification methylase
MSHLSENVHRLEVVPETFESADDVHFFWLSANPSLASLEQLQVTVGSLGSKSVVVVLTSPIGAAKLIPDLEQVARFQLWIAVKTSEVNESDGTLSQNHAALLIFSRYSGALGHTKTRISYSYCPACQKTTKDYGGKKHMYHEYGTLMSDVWRDIKVDLQQDVGAVVDRLCDLFGLEPHQNLVKHDWHQRLELEQASSTAHFENINHPQNESHLYNADCLAQLALIPDNSMDFCFADPPYNLKKRYDHWDDALESQEYFNWCDHWLSELVRVLKPGHTLAVLNIPLWAVRHFSYLSSLADLQFQNWIVWEGLSLPVRMIMPAHYGIVCFSKGKPRELPARSEPGEILEPLEQGYCLRSSCVDRRNRLGRTDRGQMTDLWFDIHRLKHNSKRVDHPCQLPPRLMERLLALFTFPDEIVLDPFNGSGTTTLVADQMKRRYIGIELSQTYHALAQRRHDELKQGIDPFAKNSETPKTKNNFVQRVEKRKYKISKKFLQLEVRRIAGDLGHIPTRDEVAARTQYPLEYFDQYFKGWTEVTAAARTTGMTEYHKDQSPQQPLFAQDSVKR